VHEKLKPLPVRGRIGIRELAKLALVDASTISRALNHDARINDERAQMIRGLAERVGYRPKPLRSKSTQSIGLLFRVHQPGVLEDQFQERIAWLAQRVLSERHLHMNLVSFVEDSSTETIDVPELIKQNRVDGVVLVGSPSAGLVAKIRALGMPAVAINDSIQRIGISCVRSDPTQAVHDAIVNLVAKGHRQIGLLMKHMYYSTAQAKYQSYAASLKSMGIEPNEQWLVSDLKDDLSGGRVGIRELMQRGRLPTAVLCENDWVAVGAMDELQRRGVRIPQDVCVMGHDDLWICQQTQPRLTSIRRSEDTLVRKVLDVLTEQIEKPSAVPREILVEGEMVWRDSTGAEPHRP